MAAEGNIVLRWGKKKAPAILKSEIVRKKNSSQLIEFLDLILDEETACDDWDTLDWCKCLISGDISFEELSKTLLLYDNAETCGLVWTANFVAYRCRTCGISPCMSLCANCFQNGNHSGHDFNMFRSQAGGACDCGDLSVMKQNGFCHHHGPDRENRTKKVPSDLLVMAEVVIPRIFLRLIQHLRSNCTPEMVETFLVGLQDIDGILQLLNDLCKMGAAMRNVLARALVNPHTYTSFTRDFDSMKGKKREMAEKSQKNYEQILESLRVPAVVEEAGTSGCPPLLHRPLVHRAMIDELLFWTVKYEFPQKLVTFLLSLLPDPSYKEPFSVAFIEHYGRIAFSLTNSGDTEMLCNRVVHISVQLFSNEALAFRMAQQMQLLHLMVYSLLFMLREILVPCNLGDSKQNYNMVVNCGHHVLKDNCYWPVISDLINVLSHKTVAVTFMGDSKLLECWMEIMACFTGMDVNVRETGQHVLYEPNTYYAAFSTELEVCSSPLAQLANHCKEQDKVELTQMMIQQSLEALNDWFDAMGSIHFGSKMQLTFHLPLHRYFSMFLAQAVNHQDIDMKLLLPSESMLKQLMFFPLRIQSGLSEIHCGMWERNGLQVRGQAMTYVQCHFCGCMVNLDLYLLQVCASQLSPDYFVKEVLRSFSVMEFLNLEHVSGHSSLFLEPEREMPMLEGALSLFVQLLTNREFLGMTENEALRQEMVCQLCVSDRTHSQLIDHIPQKNNNFPNQNFEEVLSEIAAYQEPGFEAGKMQQGHYSLKPQVWFNEYNPVHLSLRILQRKEYQKALDRYTAVAKSNGKYKGKASPWPPFQSLGQIKMAYVGMRNLLHCRTLHQFIFATLHKAVYGSKVTEQAVYLCVQLLHLALQCTPATLRHSPEKQFSDEEHLWYPTDFILTNLPHLVESVPPWRPPPPQGVATGRRRALQALQADDDSTDEEDGGEAQQDGPAEQEEDQGAMAVEDQAPPPDSPPPDQDFPAGQRLGATRKLKKLRLSDQSGEGSPPPGSEVGPRLEVGESLLTLLLKLHGKHAGGAENSYRPPRFREEAAAVASGSAEEEGTAAVGDGALYIQGVLDRAASLSEDCRRVLEDQYTSRMASKGQGSSAEERRRRAKMSQAKLMEMLAAQQKQFMKNTKLLEDMEVITSDGPTPDNPSAKGQGVEEEEEGESLECVICSGECGDNKAFGMVVLLQATSVLGHRSRSAEARRLPVREGESLDGRDLCSTAEDRRLVTLQEHYTDESSLASVNIGWEGGVHLQTCGHSLHLSCHEAYLNSLKTENIHMAGNLAVERGEFICPLCRKLANALLPYVAAAPRGAERGGGQSSSAQVQPHRDYPALVAQVAHQLQKPKNVILKPAVTRAITNIARSIRDATFERFHSFSHSDCHAETSLLFFASLARTNLELDLLERGGNLVTGPRGADPLSASKSCLGTFLKVLGFKCKISGLSRSTLWEQLTLYDLSKKFGGIFGNKEEVPILLKDPTALLLQLFLLFPFPIQKEHFRTLLGALYTLLHCQATCIVVSQLSAEERQAWQGASQPAESVRRGQMGLADLVGNTIRLIESSALFQEIFTGMQSMAAAAICQSVWSPQSIESSIQQDCLPFLRLATLLQHYAYRQPLPFCQLEEMEFEVLVNWLGLCPAVAEGGVPATTPGSRRASAPAASSDIYSVKCLHYCSTAPFGLVAAWIQQLKSPPDQPRAEGVQLLLHSPLYQSPRLLELPASYDLIFQHYRQMKCRVCRTQPRKPVVCLVCGALCCMDSDCCEQRKVFECSQHAVNCGAGTALYLSIYSSMVIIVRGQRACVWGSVYLDVHGEEDKDLRRGKPLYLSQHRYQVLQLLWSRHRIDHSAKNFMWHLNRI